MEAGVIARLAARIDEIMQEIKEEEKILDFVMKEKNGKLEVSFSTTLFLLV